MSDGYILAEFKGTYRAPHPEGIRDANVLRQFHVKVKMKRLCLEAPGLNGLFATYYTEFLRKKYPDMIETYQYNLVQATELDGSVIDNPKALDHEGLVRYINKRNYPVNASLYSGPELRNQVVLYEEDKSGQQHLEKKLQEMKGNMIAISKELESLEDLMVVCGEESKPLQPKGRQHAGTAA